MKRNQFGRGLLLAGISLLAVAAAHPRARAQSVDYGALEQLYGEPVTTSATGKPQKISEVPANMEIITQDDIRRSGADNIPDILQFITGVDVRRNAFGDASVSIRGYNQPVSPRLLVLLNGQQVYQDDYGYVPWATIPVALDEIRQIEIVKGPSTALFGFNAVSGVINIVTYDPLYDSLNAVTARVGTQNLTGGSLVITEPLGKDIGVRATAGGYLAHEYSNPQPTPKGLNPQQGFLHADAKARVAPGVVVTLSAAKADAANDRVAGVGYSLLQSFYRTNTVRVGISADSPIGTLGLNMYRNELSFDSTAGTGSIVNWIQDVYVVQASDLLQVNADHTIRLSMEYRNNSMQSPASINHTIGYQVFSGGGMWAWQITPALTLTNAARIDHLELHRSGSALSLYGFPNAVFNNRKIDEPSFNSGLVYRPTDNDTIRILASRGAQIPSLLQFGSNFGPNPNVDPTIVTNYEVDYDRAVPQLLSLIRTALYYQTNSDLLTNPTSGPAIRVPNGTLQRVTSNIGSSDELGLEVGIRGHSESGLRWNASYTYAHVTEHVTSNLGRTPDTPFDYMHGTPVHTIDLGIGYSYDKWEFDSHGKWQSEYRDYSLVSGVLRPKLISDYFTATARVGYKVTERVTLAFVAAQFNQARIAETAVLPVERRFIGSVTAKF